MVKDILPIWRPSPSSRGTTHIPHDVKNVEEERKYLPKYMRCMDCGFPGNREGDSRCDFCTSENWDRRYK